MDDGSTLGNCNAKLLVPAPKSLHVTEQPHIMLTPSLPKGKACLHLSSEKAWELYSVLENLGDERLEGRTARAELRIKRGCGQSGDSEAQSLGKGSWQQRGSLVRTDRGNTSQYLHVRVGHLQPKAFWFSSRAGRVCPSSGPFSLETYEWNRYFRVCNSNRRGDASEFNEFETQGMHKSKRFADKQLLRGYNFIYFQENQVKTKDGFRPHRNSHLYGKNILP